ncbi:hypothetical protein AB0D12_40070, partial [Streptomyces sp. NPDC048479]|uniref:hypothetical protein n=1 Tax=Streptomyces sp. NPDC048479 TaxID=3154725 RepID=UPI003429F6DA
VAIAKVQRSGGLTLSRRLCSLAEDCGVRLMGVEDQDAGPRLRRGLRWSADAVGEVDGGVLFVSLSFAALVLAAADEVEDRGGPGGQ